jgi:hypothetical protein
LSVAYKHKHTILLLPDKATCQRWLCGSTRKVTKAPDFHLPPSPSPTLEAASPTASPEGSRETRAHIAVGISSPLLLGQMLLSLPHLPGLPWNVVTECSTLCPTASTQSQPLPKPGGWHPAQPAHCSPEQCLPSGSCFPLLPFWKLLYAESSVGTEAVVHLPCKLKPSRTLKSELQKQPRCRGQAPVAKEGVRMTLPAQVSCRLHSAERAGTGSDLA